jgi:EpsI family protein
MQKIQINAIVLVFLSAIWLAGARSIPSPETAARIVEDFKEIPSQVGEWTCRDEDTKIEVAPEGLPTCTVIDKVYTNRDGDAAVLTVVYGSSLGDLHQPEVCLGGQGWSTVHRQKTMLKPGREQPFQAVVNWMKNDDTGREQIAMYWFNSKQGKSTLLPSQKVKVYVARLRRQKAEGSALVRIIAPVMSDEKRAEQAAIDLAEKVSPYVDAVMAKPVNLTNSHD